MVTVLFGLFFAHKLSLKLRQKESFFPGLPTAADMCRNRIIGPQIMFSFHSGINSALIVNQKTKQKTKPTFILQKR